MQRSLVYGDQGGVGDVGGHGVKVVITHYDDAPGAGDLQRGPQSHSEHVLFCSYKEFGRRAAPHRVLTLRADRGTSYIIIRYCVEYLHRAPHHLGQPHLRPVGMSREKHF